MVGEIRDGETAEIALQAAETGHVVVATLSRAAQTVQRFLKLIPTERVESAQSTLADILRMILCQRLLFDEQRGKRFATHEMLLQYDSVSNLIRRGEFKKLDQELETGTKRGMCSFESSLNNRISQGWSPAISEETGFSPHEITDFLQLEEEIENGVRKMKLSDVSKVLSFASFRPEPDDSSYSWRKRFIKRKSLLLSLSRDGVAWKSISKEGVLSETGLAEGALKDVLDDMGAELSELSDGAGAPFLLIRDM